MKHITIIEDDIALNNGIVLALKNDEYAFRQIYRLGDFKGIGYQASEKEQRFYEALSGDDSPCADNEPCDLIILDVNLPDGNGFDFLKKLRQTSDVPVIMLTANDLETDEVMGLTLGADDYITKPFSLMVLRARIDKILKRDTATKGASYHDENYVFDFDKMEFTVNGDMVELSKTEQKLLRLLVENQGNTLTRDILVDRIWTDSAEYVDENALSVTVNRLRSKLAIKGVDSAIHTVYGQGYVWKR